jgi:hypothetical protein
VTISPSFQALPSPGSRITHGKTSAQDIEDFCPMRQNIGHRVNGVIKKLVLALSLVGFLTIGDAAQARSLGELLKALGDSFAHPQKHPPPRNHDRPEKSRRSATKEATPAASLTATATPEQPTIRAASAAPQPKGPRRDFPYGIPVPNKQGFVTSPYAPNQGIVDVRGFPSGTEVKDPYTGKIFLTP